MGWGGGGPSDAGPYIYIQYMMLYRVKISFSSQQVIRCYCATERSKSDCFFFLFLCMKEVHKGDACKTIWLQHCANILPAPLRNNVVTRHLKGDRCHPHHDANCLNTIWWELVPPQASSSRYLLPSGEPVPGKLGTQNQSKTVEPWPPV